MKPSTELQGWIEQSIVDYCAASPERPPYLAKWAAQYHVLPTMVDWTAFWGLRPDGEILLIPTEEEGEAQIESDVRVRRMALFQGARKYPELKQLVPSRPTDALDCRHCEGRGQINPPGVEPGTIICFCGGLGWLREGEDFPEGSG